MEFNYGLLKQRIQDLYGTSYRFAESLGIPKQRLSRMLNNQASWSAQMIYKAADLLGVWNNLKEYFFTPKVHKD